MISTIRPKTQIIGSGHSGRALCEDHVSIDVRQWNHEGRLKPGYAFLHVWKVRGRRVGEVVVQMRSDWLLLSYTVKHSPEAPPIRMQQRVRLVWTGCHFGGERPWFLCTGHSQDQHCRRRAAKLYGGQGLFACRRCWGLVYRSQRLSRHSRAVEKAKIVRLRLGGTEDLADPFPPKPKGMHWSTYERLRAAAENRKQ